MNLRSFSTRALGVLLLLSVGCDRQDDARMNTTLDSTESKIERGAKVLGAKLDTAATGIKTAVKEATVQNIFDQLKGMEYVEAELENNGDVTLVGRVPDAERKEFAELVIRNVRGIGTVTNALRIDPTAVAPSDTSR